MSEPVAAPLLAAAERCDRTLAALETALIALILLGTLLGGIVQIVLRNAAGTSLPWLEPAARRGVLWIALLGASLATRTRGHLAVDVLATVLPPPVRRWLGLAVDVVAAGVCTALVIAAVRFVLGLSAAAPFVRA